MTRSIYVDGKLYENGKHVAPPPPKNKAADLSFFVQDAADRCGRLHKRQKEILVLIGKNLDQQEISTHLGISVNTVRECKQVIYQKLEVNSAIEAVVLATKAGLL